MSLRHYTDLLADRARIEAMRDGIRAVVRPGDRVLDLGTGLGTYAFFAVEAGAGEVVAVDQNPVLHLAESMALANGMSDRITFVRGTFPTDDVRGPFDVVIFEDYSGLLMDARVFRLLGSLRDVAGPNARFMPGAGRLVICLVEHPELHRAVVSPVEGLEPWHLNTALVRDFLANAPFRTHVADQHLVGAPAPGGPIPAGAATPTPRLAVEGQWTVRRDTTVHGLVAWVDLELAPGRWLSQVSLSENSWGHHVLVVDPPLDLAAGQSVMARLTPEPLDDGAPGSWRWTVEAGEDRRRGHTLAGALLDPLELNRTS